MAKSSKFSGGDYSIHDIRDVTTYQIGIIQARALRLIKRLTDESLQPFNLTSSQWFMIGAVYDAGNHGASISALSAVLGTNLPFVTNAANELVARSVLTRTSPEGNARVKLLHIHPDFIRLVPVIERHVRDVLRTEIYAEIDSDELLTYVNVLDKFTKILKPTN